MAEMTEAVFDILRTAVNLARDHQIRHLSTLKARLMSTYPDREKEVDEALMAWANYEYAKGRAALQ